MVLLGAAAFLASPAGAEEVGPAESPSGFESFLHDAEPICRVRPSTECVDRVWQYVDVDRDGFWGETEVEGLHGELREWFGRHGEELALRDRAALKTALALSDVIGARGLIDAFDADRDGRVTRNEFLADVTLDDRPLHEVLADPQAVDRRAFANRFGVFAPLVAVLL